MGIITGCLSGQKDIPSEDPIESLKKFSYPVFTITNTVHNGTGFLYKKDGRIYAITNYLFSRRVSPAS